MKGRILFTCPSNHIEYYFAGFRSSDGNFLVPFGSLYIRPRKAVIFESRADAKLVLDLLVSLGYSAKFERISI